MYEIVFLEGYGLVLREKKPNEIDYMCSKCHSCFFYKDINMGMDGRYDICMIHEPVNFYNDGHSMNRISSMECENNAEMKDIYYRDCKEYRNEKEIYDKVVTEVKGGHNEKK